MNQFAAELHIPAVERPMPQRLLLTRGTEWRKLRNWRVWTLRTAGDITMMGSRLVEMPACLTAQEAIRVCFRYFQGAEFYMWKEPDWLPGTVLSVMPCVRIAASIDARGVVGVAHKEAVNA